MPVRCDVCRLPSVSRRECCKYMDSGLAFHKVMYNCTCQGLHQESSSLGIDKLLRLYTEE